MPRALAELASIPHCLPLLSLAPQGDDHGVFVIPGLGAGDRSTYILRRFLDAKGYTSAGWGMGKNLGIARSGGADQLLDQFLAFQQGHGGKVSIIGWSLGGVHARRIARALPEHVRQVICLGSPITGSPTDTPEWNPQTRAQQNVDSASFEQMQKFQFKPIEAPCTSIYSKSDGVVPWRMSQETNARETDNIEVVASHIGLGVNPTVFYIIAKQLAQAEGHWRPFDCDYWPNRLALKALNPTADIFTALVRQPL